MWKFLGNFETYPGTYFYNSSEDINYYWNIFDQVLISNELLKYFENENVEIIKRINELQDMYDSVKDITKENFDVEKMDKRVRLLFDYLMEEQ